MLGRSRHHSGRRWEHGHRGQRCSTTHSALVVAAIIKRRSSPGGLLTNAATIP
jgi:hypothetical protein